MRVKARPRQLGFLGSWNRLLRDNWDPATWLHFSARKQSTCSSPQVRLLRCGQPFRSLWPPRAR